MRYLFFGQPTPRPSGYQRKTFFGQSSFLFTVNQKHYLMLDHWIPENLQKSGYSILPVTFDGDGAMTVRWVDTWNGPEE